MVRCGLPGPVERDDADGGRDPRGLVHVGKARLGHQTGQPTADVVGRRLAGALGIDTDDGLGVGRAQVDPVLVELDLQAIHGIHGLLRIFHCQLTKKRRNVDACIQLDLVLRNVVVGIGAA